MKPHGSARHAIDRRQLLVAARAACALGAAATFAWLLPGCSPPDDAALDARLRASLRELSAEVRGARLIAAASGMTPEQALRALRSGLSSRRLYAVTASRLLFREFIEARCSADLRAGRTRRVRGWWVAETEVAVAVLSA